MHFLKKAGVFEVWRDMKQIRPVELGRMRGDLSEIYKILIRLDMVADVFPCLEPEVSVLKQGIGQSEQARYFFTHNAVNL